MSRSTKVLILAIIVAAGAGTAAYGAIEKENDALAIANAKIPLAQAISIAEHHVQGKANRAEYERTKSGWAYDVEVVVGKKVYDVSVNSDTGTVIASTEDKADRDDEQDEKD
ncbi:MAG: hypothetical protein NVSMB6_21100 [Burkholderiaceae bacterium]